MASFTNNNENLSEEIEGLLQINMAIQNEPLSTNTDIEYLIPQNIDKQKLSR